MRIQRLRPLLLIAPLLLAGCVVGQEIGGGYQAPAAAVPAGAGPAVRVVVSDERPYVKSGEKPAFYVGRYRGGFGNSFNVSTPNDEPFATLLGRDLAADLAALGFRAGAEGAPRTLAVSVIDWNFDGYQNGRFWYDLDVRVRDAAGASLAQKRVKGEHVIKGTVWEGAKGGFEKEYPGLYAKVLAQIAHEDAEVRAALSSATAR